MKLLSATLILALSTLAQANNVNIVKTFDGKVARCGERADIGNSAYRLKNGTALVNNGSLTVKIAVDSLVCATQNNRAGMGLVPQAPAQESTRGISVTNHKLLLTDDNYNVVGTHTLDANSVSTDAEMVIALSEEQQKALKNGEALSLNLSAFIQSIVRSSDGAALSGSGSFNIKVDVEGSMAVMSIK